MKSASAPVIALLGASGGSTPLFKADLYTLTLAGGTVIRWTGHDQPVTIGGVTWPLWAKVERGSISQKRGVEVSSLEVTLWPEPTDTINGVALIPFARGGGLDGATLLLERAYGSDFQTWVGKISRFSGRLGPIRNITRDGFTFTVNSWLELLNAQFPPNLVQAECTHTLFDAGCGLTAATFANAKTVQASPAPTALAFQIANTSPVRAAAYYPLGKAVFTSGPNAGVSRTIRAFTSGGLVTLIAPLPSIPGIGDGVTLYPGCDKLLGTCTTTFANALRRKAADFVPAPETGV